jgi:hypothetical protein
MKIDWKSGSAFNHGYIDGYRVERNRGMGDKWSFMLSDSKKQYMYVSAYIYPNKEELEEAILKEIKNRGPANNP